MNTYEALLRTVWERPEDPQPLGILADWLEERGDPQAVFFRSDDWYRRDFADWAEGGQYRHPESGRLDALQLWEFAGQFFGRGRGKFLNLIGYHLGDLGLMALAQMEWVSRLRYLDISANHITDAGLAALARSPHFSSLFRLCVGANPITEAGVLALARSRSLSTLGVILTFDNHQISYLEGWKKLAAIHWPVVIDGEGDFWDYDDDASDQYAGEEVVDRDYDSLESDRPDKSKYHGPGRARRRWWGGYQVSQVAKHRRQRERGR